MTLDKMTAKELRAEIRRARAELDTVDQATPEDVYRRGDELLARYEQAATRVSEARHELRRREGEDRSLRYRLRRMQDNPSTRALTLAATWLGGTGLELVPSRLSEAEAGELQALVDRWTELAPEERTRAERLVGKAAGDEEAFEHRRARAEIKRLAAEARRLPQSTDVVAAVLADASVLDDLRYRHRDNVSETSDFGIVQSSGACQILEPEDIGVLHVLLHAIGANGGHPVHVGEQGTLADGLPRVDIARVAHLRANRLLTNKRDGIGWRTGYGPRVREIAARWNIELPAENNGTA